MTSQAKVIPFPGIKIIKAGDAAAECMPSMYQKGALVTDVLHLHSKKLPLKDQFPLEWNSFRAMKGRVKTHGAVISPEFASFELFLQHMGCKPDPSATLDRRNPHDPEYAPLKVRWATKRQQANNRRNTRYLEVNGQKKPLTEWARTSGQSAESIRQRLTRGYSDKEAVLGERLEAPGPKVSDTKPEERRVEWQAHRYRANGLFPANEPLSFSLYRSAQLFIKRSREAWESRPWIDELSPEAQQNMQEAQQILRDVGPLLEATRKGRDLCRAIFTSDDPYATVRGEDDEEETW